MATTAKTEDKVKIKLPRIPGQNEDVQVIVNGKAYLIQRGEEVEVPIAVKEILDEQEKQLFLAESIK